MKRFSKSEIAGFLKEYGKGGVTVAELAKKHGFGVSTFTNWQTQANGKAKRKIAVPKPATIKNVGIQYKIDAVKTQIGKHQRAIDQLKMRLGELLLEE